MKNTLKLFWIIVIMAVIVFSMAGCGSMFNFNLSDSNSGGGGGSPAPSAPPSLNGVWVSSSNNTVTINGNAGVWTQINHPLGQDAVRKGFIKIGDQALRNLRKTGDLTWSGQGMIFQFNTNAPNVCTGVTWSNCTITLSADGKTYRYLLSGADVNAAQTYTRK
jgi:uncharacterized lipoprotein YehR (DUF1307 family)